MGPVLDQALVLHRDGRLFEAEVLYRRALALDKNNAGVLHRLGVCLHQRGELQPAYKLLGQALRLRPSDALLHLSTGEVLRGLQRPQDALASYQRALKLAPGNCLVHMGMAAALESLGRYGEALVGFEHAQQCGGDPMEALCGRAQCLLLLGRFEESVRYFDEALQLQAGHRRARSNRAVALTHLGRAADALAALDALAAEPGTDALADAQVQANRGQALLALDRYTEALQAQDRALALVPGLEPGLLNRAIACMALNRHRQARSDLDQLLAINPHHADAHAYRGMTLLALGDFAAGWAELEWREGGLRGAGRALQARLEAGLWSGKSVLLACEQGHGDTLQFARYLGQVKSLGARIHLRVQPALRGLLLRTGHAQVVGCAGESMPRCDLYIPLMSLPYLLRTDAATIPAPDPALTADPERRRHWRQRWSPAPGARIGLAWSGNPAHANDRRRSIPLEMLAPLLHGARQFVALQSAVTARDQQALVRMPQITFFGAQIADFDDSAALVMECDLVICVDTAAAHLAGSLGRPVWILLPYSADWRWQIERDDSPWYPSARLFRQKSPGDWSGVIGDVARALAAHLAEPQTPVEKRVSHAAGA